MMKRKYLKYIGYSLFAAMLISLLIAWGFGTTKLYRLSGFGVNLSNAASVLNALDRDVTLELDVSGTLSGSAAFDKEVTLQPTPGNVITLGAYDLTAYKLGDPGKVKWLNVNSTGRLLFAAATYCRPEWFGTTGAASIQAAIDAVPAYGTVVMEDSGAWASATEIEIDKNINFIMTGSSQIVRSGAGIALNFTGSLSNAELVLNVARSNDWTAGNIGIQIEDAISSKITYVASGYEKAIYFYPGAGQTIYDNSIYPKLISTNQYGMYFDGSGGGNVNANRSFGGRFSEAGTNDDSVARVAIYHKQSGTNIHYAPLIEIVAAGVGKTYSMYCASTSKGNIIENGYCEGQDYALGVADTCRYNKVRAHVSTTSPASIKNQLYEATGLSYPGTNAIDWITVDNIAQSQGGVHEVFNINNVNRRAVVSSLDGANPYYFIPGFTFLSEAGSYTLARLGNGLAVYLNEDALFIDRTALGRIVDTQYTKNFWLTVEKGATDGYEVVVICYDASWARLTAGTHAQGISNDTDNSYAFAATTDYGGGYIMTNPQDIVFFSLESTVKHIWVGVRDNTNSGGFELGGISLKCAGDKAPPSSRPGYSLVSGVYNDVDSQDLCCINQPIGGMFGNGAKIWHLDIASGEPIGWIITARVNTTANGGEPAAETNIAVADATGISSGDIIGIIITDGSETKWHWSTVNGAPALNVVVITNAIPAGYTVADGAKIITYLPKEMASIT